MWQDEKVVRVQRTPVEMLIDDWEYESRKREAKRERFFEDLFKW